MTELTERITPEMSEEEVLGILLDEIMARAAPDVAEAIRFCAIPHWFNEEIIAWLRGEGSNPSRRSRKILAALTELTFVGPYHEWGWAYHENVRDLLLRRRRERDSEAFKELSGRAAGYFAHKLGGGETFLTKLFAAIQRVLGKEGALTEDERGEYRREQMYHLLAADPEQGFELFRRMFNRARNFYQLSTCALLLELAEEQEAHLSLRQRRAVEEALRHMRNERLFPASIRKFAHLIRARREAGDQPYILFLGSSLSLTPEVRRAACKSDDWEAFWTTMERLSDTERRVLMTSPLAELNLAPCYRCLAELAQAGYFNIIFTANIDDALDNALRILPASERKVLCHGEISAQEITSALSRPTPRVKVIKLRGDINAYKLPLTPEGQFEFPEELEEAVEQLLSQDMILVGDIPYDADIQRHIREGDGALWVVVPEEPRPGSFLYSVKQARPRGEIITGPGAEFEPFLRALVSELDQIRP